MPRLFLLIPALWHVCVLSPPCPDIILSDSVFLSLTRQNTNSGDQLSCSAPAFKQLNTCRRNSTSSFKRYLSWAPQCCSAIPWHFSSLLHSARHHFTPPRLSYKPLPAPSSSQSLLTCLVISLSSSLPSTIYSPPRLNDPLNKSDPTISAQDPPSSIGGKPNSSPWLNKTYILSHGSTSLITLHKGAHRLPQSLPAL